MRLRPSGKTIENGNITVKYASRPTTHRSIWHHPCVMQDLLQHIDLDYYRSAQLLIVRAEIAQLRQQSSALAYVERHSESPIGTSHPVDDFSQLLA